ncbi:phage tail protein [Solobacterium moorei]|uniref:phage tail protein n=1 Tax=Solobacterium moorei TaxID=102148 RepID=UPI0028D42114|nr:phage tail protein [Solobacterium moorei]
MYDEKHQHIAFDGRVLVVEPSMDSSGLILKRVTCEGKLAYLNDTIQEYCVPKNWTTKGLLQQILKVHNARVDVSKVINLGNVQAVDANDNIYVGIQYDSSWKTLVEKLVKKSGGEFQFRNVNGLLYLDYLKQTGEEKNTAIVLAKNMQSITQKIDSSSLITRLYPYGAKIKAKDESGNEKETEERLSISSVNAGKPYVEDAEYLSRYGVVETTQFWDDVNSLEILKSKGAAWLKENNRITVSYEIDAFDLSLIDVDSDELTVGNIYPVRNELLDIDEKLRVISRTIDVIEPHKTTLEFGSKKQTLTNMQTSINQYVVETVEKNVKANAEITQSNIDNTRKYAAEITENAKSTVVKMVESTNDELKETKLKVKSNGSAIEAMQKNVDSIDGSQLSGNKIYYLQTSVTGEPSKESTEWSTVRPVSISGQHMWMMAVDVLKNGTEIKHTPVDLTGQPGESGRGIVGTPKMTYQGSTSGTIVPNGEWSEEPPLLNDGMYLWIKKTTSYSDGTSSDEYAVTKNGNTGSAGVGIKDDPIREYYLSTSKTELNGGEWSDTKPQVTTGKFVWTRYKITYTDLHVGYTTPSYDDALDRLYEVSYSNKTAIEQLINSVNLSVQETTAIKKSLQSTNDDLHALEAQTQQYATKAELQLTKDSISQTLTEEIDGKTAVLKQIKLQSDGMHIQGKEGSTTEQVLDEKSSKIVVNGKVMVDVNSTETRVQSLKAEGNFATGAHKFKRGTLKEISGETVACTNIYWIGGE